MFDYVVRYGTHNRVVINIEGPESVIDRKISQRECVNLAFNTPWEASGHQGRRMLRCSGAVEESGVVTVGEA